MGTRAKRAERRGKYWYALEDINKGDLVVMPVGPDDASRDEQIREGHAAECAFNDLYREVTEQVITAERQAVDSIRDHCINMTHERLESERQIRQKHRRLVAAERRCHSRDAEIREKNQKLERLCEVMEAAIENMDGEKTLCYQRITEVSAMLDGALNEVKGNNRDHKNNDIPEMPADTPGMTIEADTGELEGQG